MTTLRVRLALAMVALTVLPLSFYLMANLLTTRRTLQLSAADHLSAIAHLRTAELEHWSSSHEAAVALLAGEPRLVADVLLLVEGQAGIALAVAAQNRVVDLHLDPAGRILGFSRLLVLAVDSGQILASTERERVGEVWSDPAVEAAGIDAPQLWPPHRSAVDGTLVLTAAGPILDEDHRLIGVLLGEFPLQEAVNRLAASEINFESEDSFLVNAQGMALTELRFIENAVLTVGVATPAILHCLTGQSTRGWGRDYRGIPVIGAYEYLPTQQICLAIEVDEAEALQPLKDLGRGQLAVFLLTALASLGTGLTLAGRISEPLEQMRQHAAGLAAGDLSVRMPEANTDELQRLGQTFNLMAAELQSNIGKLEAEVEKRTADLAQAEFEVRTLLDSSEALALGEDLEHSLEQVLALLCARGKWVYAEAWLANEDGERLARGAYYQQGGDLAVAFALASADLQFAKGQGVVGRVWQTAEPEWIQDVLTDDDPVFSRVNLAREAELHAVLAVPAAVGSEVLAVLTFFSDATREEDSETASLTLAVARQLGPAIQRRAALEALELSEARYLALFHEMPVAMYRTTVDGRFLDANQALINLLGYPDRKSLLSHPLQAFYIDPIERAQWIEKLRKVGEISEFETQVKRGDGQPIWVRQSTRLRHGANGGGEILEGAVIDITPRKMAEETLRSYASELRRSNQELEQFAYIASHDLQEPLRMVSSYVQLLQQRYADKLDDEANEFIEYAVDGAARMQRLINDLLAFSRVGTRGKDPGPVDSQTVFQRILRTIDSRLREAEAQVEVAALPVVLADEGQLEQVFTNLISNAIKYRGQQPPRIRVEARRDGAEWIFQIADNGIGIDPQYFDRIFIIFQRLHTRQAYEGTGIGLAMCKKIVERHGGRIWLESEPGKGSTFYFTLLAVPEGS